MRRTSILKESLESPFSIQSDCGTLMAQDEPIMPKCRIDRPKDRIDRPKDSGHSCSFDKLLCSSTWPLS